MAFLLVRGAVAPPKAREASSSSSKGDKDRPKVGAGSVLEQRRRNQHVLVSGQPEDGRSKKHSDSFKGADGGLE